MFQAFVSAPFQVDGLGSTSTHDHHAHAKNMMRQVLLTRPGERVNRPQFGCPLYQHLFHSEDEGLAAAAQHEVRDSLNRYLSDVLKVHDVRVAIEGARLEVTVVYNLLGDDTRRTAHFVR